MKLLSLTCPNCGANIEANAEFTMCTCNYCGKQFLIDDEYKRERKWNEQEGFDFENGRIRAQKEEAERVRLEQLRREAEAKHRLDIEQKRLAVIFDKNKAIYWLAFLGATVMSFSAFFSEDLWPYAVLLLSAAISLILLFVDVVRYCANGVFHDHYSKSFWVTALFPGYVVGAVLHFIWFLTRS